MKTYSLLSSAVTVVFALAVGGCAVGPDYHAPPVTTPANWSEPLTLGETNSPPAVAAWWKTFHDPELDSLIERAEKSNLDLRQAQSRVQEARARYRLASSGLWPSANATGSLVREGQSHNQPLIGQFPLPPGIPFAANVYQAGFDASWEIDVFGGTRRALESSKAQFTATEYGRRATLVTLFGEVARDYLEVRGDQRRLAIANENIQAQQVALGITRDRYTNGLTSELDVQQASTLLANTRAEVPTLEGSIQTNIHRLSVLLGQPPGALLAELSTPAPIPVTPPEIPVGLPSELLLRRPDVRQAERRLAAATADIGVARADLFPKFFLTGSAGLESVNTGDFFNNTSRMFSIGPSAQWRIFDAGRIRANIRVQNARQEQALEAYEQTVLTAFQEVEDNLVSYAKEQARRDALRDAVTSSQSSLELARRLYANGLSDFLNVLDAERSLYQEQDELAQSERTVASNLIALYKSLGGGWETAEPPVALALEKRPH